VAGSVLLENEALSLEILPRRGGKIASLFDKSGECEWLYQGPAAEELQETRAFRGARTSRPPGGEPSGGEPPGGEPPAEQPPGGEPPGGAEQNGDYPPFTKEESFGFDEMFPTILPHRWVDSAGNPHFDPDHGRLWSQPWEILEQGKELLTLACHSPEWSFQRTILLDRGSVRISYRVESHSLAPFPALWAAHPLFTFYDETVLLFPESMGHLRQAMDDGQLLGPYGAVSPLDRLNSDVLEQSHPFSYRPASLPRGTCLKFYNETPLTTGGMAIQDRRGTLALNFSAEQLPWLGFWINNGAWGKQHNFAPEPATAPMDSPEKAEHFGHSVLWSPGEEREWEMELLVDSSKNKMPV
jgi:galactose mutarotase-like enzyme